MIAQDIQLGTSHNLLGLPELRRCHGWWKRYSFFSSIGVKEIKIRFLDFEKSKNEIQVVATDFDHSSDIAHYNLTIEEAVKVEVDADKCGIDMMGRRHEKNFHCANSAYDNILQEVYCKIERVSDLAQLKSEAQWLSSMLEFYWQNGIGDKGLRFLRKNGFVTRYRCVIWSGIVYNEIKRLIITESSSLEYDTYADAANPYGKTIKAFLLIEGWHVRYLLCLVAGSLVCSVCIVAIATVVTRSIEAGLTAGSYGLGLTAIVLAVLTLLSAII
ncbi:MAG: hypothetical protein M1827_002031 [Pycnora praestabilis]|nr:MAG: hypothetical protein M1827_002031 [Pycnora praestabilis]